MKTLFAIAILLCTSASLASSKSRPMSEMHGDCSNFKTDMSTEMKAWAQAPVAIAETSEKPLPISNRISLALKDSANVTFEHPPEKAMPAKGPMFAGVFVVRPAKSGTLRISTGSRLWFDLVDKAGTKLVEASEFEMQTKCPKIYKTVAFSVEANKTYSFQVSGSSAPKADFLFTIR